MVARFLALALAVTASVASANVLRQLPMGFKCAIEDGYDYPGYDIKQTQGGVNTCCSACRQTSGCAVWSWNMYKGGTCYLKGSGGKLSLKAGVKSGHFVADMPDVKCISEDGVDFEDPNLDSVKAAKVDDCCGICQKRNGCNYYSWNNYQGGTCWLKATRNKPVLKAGVISGQSNPTWSPAYTYDGEGPL